MLFKKIALNQVRNYRSLKPGLNYDQIKIVAQSVLNSGYPLDMKITVLAALYDRHRRVLGELRLDNQTKPIPPGRSGFMDANIDCGCDFVDNKIIDMSRFFSEELLPSNQVKPWVVKALTNPINPMPGVPLMTLSEAINVFDALDFFQISGASDWVTDLYGQLWSRKPADQTAYFLPDLMKTIDATPSLAYENKSVELTDIDDRRHYVLTQIQSGEIKSDDLLWLFASFRDVLKADIDPITLQLASKFKKSRELQRSIYFLYASVRDQLSSEEAALKRAETIQSSSSNPRSKRCDFKVDI